MREDGFLPIVYLSTAQVQGQARLASFCCQFGSVAPPEWGRSLLRGAPDNTSLAAGRVSLFPQASYILVGFSSVFRSSISLNVSLFVL